MRLFAREFTGGSQAAGHGHEQRADLAIVAATGEQRAKSPVRRRPSDVAAQLLPSAVDRAPAIAAAHAAERAPE